MRAKPEGHLFHDLDDAAVLSYSMETLKVRIQNDLLSLGQPVALLEAWAMQQVSAAVHRKTRARLELGFILKQARVAAHEVVLVFMTVRLVIIFEVNSIRLDFNHAKAHARELL